MAMLLAPYNNAMRIGQGFNSYTQQICINDAVVVDKDEQGGDHYTAEEAPDTSQIVSYATRYVDKLSDVTSAMNISAHLSIKTGTVGGSANGSYVNSDKFKESEINYFVQVKVTNQTIMANDVKKFNKIENVPASALTKIYGDCFISGFVEGGELDALISIKILNQEKERDIKAGLEASFGKGGVGGDLGVSFAQTSKSSSHDSQTSITVNWNGGGKIKDEHELWSIDTVTKAAAAFPFRVAKTPQRIYAILTPYTSLRSFQVQMHQHKPLDYQNANIYTEHLMDQYMDYKSMWTDIANNSSDLEFDRVRLVAASSTVEPTLPLLPNRIFSPDEIKKIMAPFELTNEAKKGYTQQELASAFTTLSNATREIPPVYEPTIEGLEQARRDCRMQMNQIVKEVDDVTDNPEFATDPTREDKIKILPPALFRKRLPLRLDLPKTGFSLYTSPKPIPLKVQTWINEQNKKAESQDFHMSEYAGDASKHEPDATFYDRDDISTKSTVTKVEFWGKDNCITAYRLTYQDGKTVPSKHDEPRYKNIGTRAPDSTFNLISGDKIVHVVIDAAKTTNIVDHSVCVRIALITLKGGHHFYDPSNLTPEHHKKDETRTHLITRSPHSSWSLKGFWGQQGDAFTRLGVFWGKDEPADKNSTAVFSR